MKITLQLYVVAAWLVLYPSGNARSQVAGDALQFDGIDDYVFLDGLAVNTSSGTKTTVEFWMKWGGDYGGMPFGWGHTI